MTELRDAAAKAILDAMDVTDGLDATAAERYAEAVLAIPEIAEELEASANLRANQEKQRRMLGHSIKVR